MPPGGQLIPNTGIGAIAGGYTSIGNGGGGASQLGGTIPGFVEEEEDSLDSLEAAMDMQKVAKQRVELFDYLVKKATEHSQKTGDMVPLNRIALLAADLIGPQGGKNDWGDDTF